MRQDGSIRRILLATFVVIGACSAPASAQSRVDVAGGYTFTHITRKVSFPLDAPVRPLSSADQHGWEIASTIYLHRAVGLTFETGRQTRHENIPNVDFSLSPVLGGVSVRVTPWRQLRPFVSALAGAVRLGADDGAQRESQTFPAIQFGGGGDVMISPAVGLRLSFDYMRRFRAESNHFKTFVGVVVPIR